MQNETVSRAETFLQTFPINQIDQVSIPNFVAISGNLGGQVPLVDDVLTSQEQDICLTTSHDENCIEFDFQTDPISYVYLSYTYLALKPELVKGGFERNNTEEVRKEHKEESKKGKEAGEFQDEKEVE